MKVHERLKRYIADNGIKQIHVAEKSEIDFLTFNNKLLGRGKITVDEFEKICGIFFDDQVLKTKTNVVVNQQPTLPRTG